MSEDPRRYPVGRFAPPVAHSAASRRSDLAILRALPGQVRALVAPLAPADLERRYRPGGWTIRQLAHHLPDSHMNAYVRMKLALTEDRPAVKTYDEAAWAELPDSAAAPVAVSLDLLAALHTRWVALLEGLDEGSWQRQFQHPEWGAVSLEHALAQYAWHSRHHLAHLQLALGG